MGFTVILVFELYVLQVYFDPCCDVLSSLAIWSFTFVTTFQFLYTFYELLEVCHDGLYFFLLSFSFSFYFEFVHI